MRVLHLACLLLAGVVICDEAKSYRGHHVLSAKASTEDQLTVLRNMEDQFDVVYLREPSLVVSTVMVVPPEQKGQLLDTLRDAGIDVTVQSSDLQEAIDAEKKESFMNRRRQEQRTMKSGRGYYYLAHNFYRNLTEVQWAMEIFSAYSSDVVTMDTMNFRTHEGRSVQYLQLGTKTDSNGNVDKPVIFIEGLAHAREWVTTASLLYAIDEVLRQYRAGDALVKTALQEFTWIIIPVVNPDGYAHTWDWDRLWRKNRKPHRWNSCRGVDLNRNYDARFGEVGVSMNCRSDIYPGEAAFSEVETRNVRDLFLEFKSRVVAFLSVHAYSQVLLHPWAHSESSDIADMPPNFLQLYNTGMRMTEALTASGGKKYTFGTPYQALGYAASGGSYDWALQEKPGIYSYCYELRPDGGGYDGFLLPADQIGPTGDEMLRSLLVLTHTVMQERQAA